MADQADQADQKPAQPSSHSTPLRLHYVSPGMSKHGNALARTDARTVRTVQGTFCLSTLNMDYTNLDIDTADMLAPYAIAGALQLNAQRAVAEGVFCHRGGSFYEHWPRQHVVQLGLRNS